MHMADALISPAVGGAMLAASAGLLALSGRKIRREYHEKMIPLMGVAGAFVFAAQMVNFSIPGTGSSGHLGGGLLLAVLLGPWAGFLAMASILVVQALCFADGGVLALGCNIFNLGFWTCFVAYPLLYRPIAGGAGSRKRVLAGSLAAGVAGLQLGAFSVVVETVLSGRTELPFGAFVLAMQPLHLAIGIVEGLVTAAVILFVVQSRPEILEQQIPAPAPGRPIRVIAVSLLLAALITGGVLSWFASPHPDGLEWSLSRVSGREELQAAETAASPLATLQQTTAILPGYSFKEGESPANPRPSWPAVDAGTSLSGLVGGALTFALVAGLACVMKWRSRPAGAQPS